MLNIPDRVAERVLTRWTQDDECWISDYSVMGAGYAQIGWSEGGRRIVTLAHRVAWAAANNSPIPDEMTIDHICFVRRCVNPEHLRLMSRSENSGRHEGPWIPRTKFKPRTRPSIDQYCGRGHQMARTSTGAAYCRECKRLSAERCRARSATS